jgi:hypothetical protein
MRETLRLLAIVLNISALCWMIYMFLSLPYPRGDDLMIVSLIVSGCVINLLYMFGYDRPKFVLFGSIREYINLEIEARKSLLRKRIES